MALLKVKSSNPKMSFILKKNPASGMNIFEHKSGHLFGWYNPSGDTYQVWFKDKLQANSYGEQDFNNTLQYSSPLFVLDSLNLFFNENLKKLHPEDTDGFLNSLTVNLVAFANNRLLEVFKKQFSDYTFEIEEVSNCKKITISTTKPLHQLVNLSAVLFALFELRKTDLYVDVSLLTKYLNCLNRIQAPYFIRYMFKMYLLRNYRDFTECKTILEDGGKYQLTHGDNYLSRVRATEQALDLSIPIADIGCGEGRFLNFIAHKVPLYLAVDTDPTVLTLAQQKIKKHELNNVEIFSETSEFYKKVNTLPKVNALLIEVIEHMPMPSAEELITSTLKLPNLDTLVLTTPDRDFNKHYLIDGFRHDDHKFELTMGEFQELITRLKPENFKVEFVKIGDSIDGISTTIGAILRRAS